MMFKAKKRGADTIEMFSDSPPWWMNSNLSSAGGDTGRANLTPENDVRFAVYLASVAQYAANNWGVVFSSVEPFNEPSSGWWDYPCRQEGCHIPAKQQQDIIQDLRRELDRRGLDTVPIAASDENTYDLSLRT